MALVALAIANAINIYGMEDWRKLALDEERQLAMANEITKADIDQVRRNEFVLSFSCFMSAFRERAIHPEVVPPEFWQQLAMDGIRLHEEMMLRKRNAQTLPQTNSTPTNQNESKLPTSNPDPPLEKSAHPHTSA